MVWNTVNWVEAMRHAPYIVAWFAPSTQTTEILALLFPETIEAFPTAKVVFPDSGWCFVEWFTAPVTYHFGHVIISVVLLGTSLENSVSLHCYQL